MVVKKEPQPTWKCLSELSKLTVKFSHDIRVLSKFLSGSMIDSHVGWHGVFFKPELFNIHLFTLGADWLINNYILQQL
jgi:hypothetical protein